MQPAATVGIAWLGYCRRHGIIMRIVKIIIKKIVGRERFGRSTPAMSGPLTMTTIIAELVGSTPPR
ncbi:MAG TPA: hypothetical protein VFR94_01375 [Nitrososphaeraceae archaeon]|nr:hypothetical protein [Nitrososphaeraceae archaeon]